MHLHQGFLCTIGGAPPLVIPWVPCIGKEKTEPEASLCAGWLLPVWTRSMDGIISWDIRCLIAAMPNALFFPPLACVSWANASCARMKHAKKWLSDVGDYLPRPLLLRKDRTRSWRPSTHQWDFVWLGFWGACCLFGFFPKRCSSSLTQPEELQQRVQWHVL